MKNKLIALAPIAAACTLALVGMNANAAGIISNGTVALGIKDSGALNVGGTSTIFGPTFTSPGTGTVGGTGVRGLFVNGTSGYEATYPGCLCEGWGVAIAGGPGSGITGYDGNGFANLSGGAAVMGVDVDGFGTATTVRTIANAAGAAVLSVTHDFHATPLTPYLYQVDVTIKNLTAGTLGAGATDLRYTRLMDFDTEPTAFSEFITIQRGGATNLLTTSDDGFEVANPLFATSSLAACAPVGASFVDCGPNDHGARFDFGFAALGVDDPTTPDVDESVRKFTIYYGAAPTEALADAARVAVGAGVYAYGQCSSAALGCSPTTGAPITYIFAFGSAGVGAPDPTVPEPATLALMGLGLAGLGLARRRKTAA